MSGYSSCSALGCGERTATFEREREQANATRNKQQGTRNTVEWCRCPRCYGSAGGGGCVLTRWVARAWYAEYETFVFGGTDSVIHVFAPITELAPITVFPPRIVAP